MRKTKLLLLIVSLVVLFSLAFLLGGTKNQNSIMVPEDIRAEVYFDIGQYYFNHDNKSNGAYDLAEAKKHYELAVTKDPKVSSEAWYQLGRVYFIEGDFDVALEMFAKQIEYFGDEVPNVYYMIGLTHGYRARVTGNKEDWVKGEEAFLEFIRYAPLAPWSRVDLAWIYFAQGKYEEMQPVLEEGLLYRPNNAWLLNMYGLSLLNTEDTAGALQQFLLAKENADKLTEEDWGNSYPGNNPELWGRGLTEFKSLIQKNIDLAEAK